VDEDANFINPRIKDLPSWNIKSELINWKKLGYEIWNIVYANVTDQIGKYLILLSTVKLTKLHLSCVSNKS
jgi:hypothetical protein